MSAAPKLYELDARCPRCGFPPRVRVPLRTVLKYAEDPPGELAQTYQCAFHFGQGRKCNTIYALTAGAFQRAVELEG